MGKQLTTFHFILLTVGSVDSIRNLPAVALVGNDIFLYFGLAFIFFLLPCASVVSWFSRQSTEGIYGWVKQSLGHNAGLMAIWLQWLQNIVIYPTFFSFIAGAMLYCIDPSLVNNKYLLFVIINLLIWGLTAINLKGIYLSNQMNTFCSIVGVLLPFLLILGIGLFGVLNHPNSLILVADNHPPQDAWTSLTAIVLSFCGLEIAAVHMQNSKRKAYAKAVAIATVIIFITMLFGGFTLAIFIPADSLNLISGISEIIGVFFTQIDMTQLALVTNLLIVIGCIGCANNWLLAPVKGLLFASKDYQSLGQGLNSQSSEKLLFIQACGISLVSAIFLLFPFINTSYWLMLTLATQMYMLMYLLMFLGAIKQNWGTNNKSKWFIVVLSFLGILGIGMVLVVSFTPPSQLVHGSKFYYDFFLITCLLLMALMPRLGRRMIYSK